MITKHKQSKMDKRLFVVLITHTIASFLSLQLVSCCSETSDYGTPLTEEPTIQMELEMEISTEVSTDWDFGWDAPVDSIWDTPSFNVPNEFQLRRYYNGDNPEAPHTNVESFFITGTSFQSRFQFGYYDLLFWSEIESKDGSQVVVINEDINSVTATTTGTRGLSRAVLKLIDVDEIIETDGIIGMKNQPEVFYSAYTKEVYISNDPSDYTYDEKTNTYRKVIKSRLRPMVYTYLIRIVLLNNDGRIKDVNGNGAISGMASATNLMTGTRTNPTIVYLSTQMEHDKVYDDKKCDIIFGMFNTFGLCDGRSDLSNHLLFDLVFDNNAVKTFSVEVTDQFQEQTKGGIITLIIDCGEVEKPDPPKPDDPVNPDDPDKPDEPDNPDKPDEPDEPLPTSGSLFIPTVEDYEDVIWEVDF